MSGTPETWERDSGLRGLAKARHTEPMNTWPEHEKRHYRTLMGARLYDGECLRCHLESVAIEAAKASAR